MTRPPTQLELMQFADGELDEARAREIERHLAASAEARAFVSSIGTLGDLIRDSAAHHAADALDVSDAVMSAIDSALSAQPPAPIAQLDEARRQREAQSARKGATLLALTLAAAAALVIWLNVAGRDDAAVEHGPVAQPSAVASVAQLPSDEASGGDDGTAVDNVDFGERLGAIFYVPTGVKSAMTTVVWISDDEASQ